MKFLQKMLQAMSVSLMLLFAPAAFNAAHAGDGTIITGDAGDLSGEGVEFQNAYLTIKGWLEGYLGKLLIIIFFLVGIFMAIAKRDLMSTLGAFALAFIVSIAPNILEQIA